MTLSDGCNLFVLAWLSLWAGIAGASILKGRTHSISFVIITHWVLSGFPAGLDLLFGRPWYLTFPAFDFQDERVDLLYAAYVAICPVIWWRLGRDRSLPNATKETWAGHLTSASLIPGWRAILFLAAFSPLIAVAFAPDPYFYSAYAAIIRSPLTDAIITFHKWILATTLLSVLSVGIMLAVSSHIWRTLLRWAPVLCLTFWLNGKRFIVMLAIALILIVLWERGVLRGRKLAAVGMAASAGFAVYSYSYQTGARSTDLLGAAQQYENVRIDYGRDHGIKHALYCELNPQEPSILEFPGESFLYDLTMYVPRDIWSDKPWPYAVYSTAAALGVEVQDLGWNITASWLERSVAEFGFLGLLIGPLVVAIVCRLGDSSRNGFVRFLTMVLVCLMLAMSSSFPIVKLSWVASMVWAKLKRPPLV